MYNKTHLIIGTKYYTDKFKTGSDDLFYLKQAARVAQLFDPMFLKDKSIQLLELLADDLTYFRYGSIFSPTFIPILKRELPSLVEEAKKEFNWKVLTRCSKMKDISKICV